MKIYEVRTPSGELISLEGSEYLVFLRNNNLDRSHMNKTLTGTCKTCKGFILNRRFSINYENLQKVTETEMKHYKTATILRDQTRELRSLIRNNSRFEWLKNEIVTEIRKMKPIEFTPSNSLNDSISNIKVAVCPISDWHIGLNVENSLNVYNVDVFKQRVSDYTDNVIKLGLADGVCDLTVLNLGDMINGVIHNSLRIGSDIDVVQQVILASETISVMLTKFAELFNVSYGGTYGNHDRITANKKNSIEKESFGILINYYVKTRVASNRRIKYIENTFSDDIINFKLFDFNIIGTHGDKENISSVISNYSSMMKIIPDVAFLGHLHHMNVKELNGSFVIVNPSLIGTDDYAFSIRKTSTPSQLYVLIDKTGIIKEEIVKFSV